MPARSLLTIPCLALVMSMSVGLPGVEPVAPPAANDQTAVPTERELHLGVSARIANQWRSPAALGMDPASPLLHQAPPAVTVDRWLAGSPVTAFAADKTYVVCIGSVIDLDLGRLLDQIDDGGQGAAHPGLSWIVILTPPAVEKGQEATQERIQAYLRDEIEGYRAQLKGLPVSVALDTADGKTRQQWQVATPRWEASGPNRAQASFIHHGQVIWGGPIRSPWLNFLRRNIAEIGDHLPFVERQVAEVQRRARPLLDLTAAIWERGYPLPGELERVLILASMVERADLQTGFVDYVDGLGGTMGGGAAFGGQRLLWWMFNEMVRDVFSSDPFRPLNAQQKEQFLAEFRRLATAEEFDRVVGHAKSYDAMRRVIQAHQARKPEQVEAALAELEAVGEADGLLVDAKIIADDTHDAVMVRRLVATARTKAQRAGEASALLIEQAAAALKAVDVQAEVRPWAVEALAAVRDPGEKARIQRVLDAIR